MGRGPVVTIAEASGRGLIASRAMVKWLADTAESSDIPIQFEVGAGGRRMLLPYTSSGVVSRAQRSRSRVVISTRRSRSWTLPISKTGYGSSSKRSRRSRCSDPGLEKRGCPLGVGLFRAFSFTTLPRLFKEGRIAARRRNASWNEGKRWSSHASSEVDCRSTV